MLAAVVVVMRRDLAGMVAVAAAVRVVLRLSPSKRWVSLNIR